MIALIAEARSVSAAPGELADRPRAEVYQVACAACHGDSGQISGDEARLSHFARPPASLNDPLFNSREPAADWFLVVKHGGPALGLSSQMPSYGDAFTDEEIRSLVGHIKTLAGDHGYPPGDLNFFLPIRTIKAFPEDELVLKTRYTEEEGSSAWRNTYEFEKRIGKRHQLNLELIHDIEDGAGDLSEMELGWKTALTYSLERQFILSSGAKLAIPFENEGQFEGIPFVAAAKGLSDHFTLQTSLRSHLPFERFDEGDVEASGVVHWLTTEWPRGIFPALELTARVPFERGGDDALQLSVTPQLHMGLSKGGHVRMNAGVEVPVTRRTYDYRVYIQLVWDWADGWFWERW